MEIIGKRVRGFGRQAITAPATVDEMRFVITATVYDTRVRHGKATNPIHGSLVSPETGPL
tara:strand:- start:688 stop:867 length:180 start_codon:yes stop_codon:yes gene_type:complete